MVDIASGTETTIATKAMDTATDMTATGMAATTIAVNQARRVC